MQDRIITRQFYATDGGEPSLFTSLRRTIRNSSGRTEVRRFLAHAFNIIVTYRLVDASVTRMGRPLMGFYLGGVLVARPDIIVTLDLQGRSKDLVFSHDIPNRWDNSTGDGLHYGSRVKVALYGESGRIAGIVYGDLGFIPDHIIP